MKYVHIPALLVLLLAACGSSTDKSTSIEPADGTAAPSVDPTLFFDGAFAEDITIQDCSLSDGTETTCYSITITGYPADHEVGPFCPETTSASAAEGGIWFDGNGIYQRP